MTKDRKLLFFLLVLGISSGSELFAILSAVSPRAAAAEVYWAFFLSAFGSLSVLLALAWHRVRCLAHPLDTPSLWSSWRQGSLLAGVVVLAFFLNSLSILTLWDFVPVTIAAILIEFFFQADKTSSHEPA